MRPNGKEPQLSTETEPKQENSLKRTLKYWNCTA